MITDEQIEGMASQHKGGYSDIVLHLEKIDGHSEIMEEIRENVTSTGEFASRIQSICMNLGFPRPDMKSWQYACTAKAWQLKPKEKDESSS